MRLVNQKDFLITICFDDIIPKYHKRTQIGISFSLAYHDP